jgi:hypothetical protein
MLNNVNVLVILAEEVGIEPNTLTSTLSLAKKHQPSQHHLPYCSNSWFSTNIGTLGLIYRYFDITATDSSPR